MNMERRQFIPDPADKMSKGPDLPGLFKSLKELQSSPQLYKYQIQELRRNLRRALWDQGKDQEEEKKIWAELLNNIIQRVEAECGQTDNFGSLEEGKRLMNVPTADFMKDLYPNIDNPYATGSVASYEPLDKKIKTSHELNLDPENLVMDFVQTGFNDSLTALHHEVIHSKQDDIDIKDKKIQLRLLLDRTIAKLKILKVVFVIAAGSVPKITIPTGIIIALLRFRAEAEKQKATILEEGQAFIGSARNSGGKNALKTVDELVETLEGYGIWKGNVDKIFIMSHDIKRLYALGMSDESIGEIVKRTKWNEVRKCYDDIENAVQALSVSSGLTETQIDDLVEADEIKSAIYVEKLKRIAQEELQKVAADLKLSEAA